MLQHESQTNKETPLRIFILLMYMGSHHLLHGFHVLLCWIYQIGIRDKEHNFWAKPSTLGKTFLRILDPEIPRFGDSVWFSLLL